MPIISLLGLDFSLISISILLSIYIKLLSPNELSSVHSFIKLSEYSTINFRYIYFYYQFGVNISIFESLLFYNKETNFRDIYLFYPTLTRLAILIATILSDLFDIDIIESLIIANITILYFSMGY